MTDIIAPTSQDIRNELLESVDRQIDDSWRHGNYVTEVFHREADDTYWRVGYCVSGDGEYNGLREDSHFSFDRVRPVEKVITIIEYVDHDDAKSK